MKTRVQNFINQKHLFLKDDKIILGISGGGDSVCLMHLLLSLDYNIELAHCNFNLRGEESDADELFVRQLAEKFKLKLHVKSFDVNQYILGKKVSTQMAARDLRYNWFQYLLEQENAAYIAIAHHANDDVETFFINLIRGTGIEGLLGIKERNKKVVRPLMMVSRKEIEDYLKKNNLEYREDSSNQSVKYLRNKIRHKLMPLLEEMNPKIGNTVSEEMKILEGVSEVYYAQVNKMRKDLLLEVDGVFKIELKKLKNLKPLNNYLYELLKPFGFTEVQAIIRSLDGQSGKQFFSKTHQLILDRDFVIISKLNIKNEDAIIIDIETNALGSPFSLKFLKTKEKELIKDLSFAQLDMDKLQFPLILRKWKKGDRFKPLGMSSFKKLSDFFIDNKFSILDKQEQWLLCSGADIVWVVGCRIDERYKLQPNTKNVYLAQLLK